MAGLLGLVAAAASPARADPLEEIERFQQALFDKTAPSVVYISTASAFGSGFFVSADGLVLTNEHVIHDQQGKIEVVLQDGRKMVAQVVEKAMDDIDLALLQVPVKGVVPLSLGGIDDLRVGSWLGSVGHGLGGIWTFATGMVTNIYPSGSERPVFQTQIPLNPGCSGGPILDRKGRVVGVTTAGIQSANNVNFGIRADVAMRSLRKLAELCNCIVITAAKDAAVFVDGRMVGRGPRVVVPAEARAYDVMAVHQGQMKKAKLVFPAQRTLDLTK